MKRKGQCTRNVRTYQELHSVQADGASAAVLRVELGLVVGEDTLSYNEVARLPPMQVVGPFVERPALTGAFHLERLFPVEAVVFLAARRQLASNGRVRDTHVPVLLGLGFVGLPPAYRSRRYPADLA